MIDVHALFLRLTFLMPLVMITSTAIARTGSLAPELASFDQAQTPVVLDDSLRSAAPQNPADKGRPAPFEAITNLPGDWFSAGGLALRPASVPALTGTATLTGMFLLTDRVTFADTKDLTSRNPGLRNAAGVMVHLGDGTMHLGLAAAFGLYGFAASDNRSLRIASETVESMLATGITVQLLKHISGRESPAAATHGGGEWRPFPNLKLYQKNQPRYYSFPSGHIATTAGTLTVLAENFPDQWWIPPAGYAILAGVGFSLVDVRYHWFSDLPLGVLLGHTFGMIAAHNGDGMSGVVGTTPYHAKVVVKPSVTPEGRGVEIALLF